LFVSAAVAVMPNDPHRLTAVYPPWWSAAEGLVAASRAGSIGAIGGLPFVVAVHSEDSGLAARLRAGGAVFVLDGSSFMFCSG
jgi:hypothetical protein